MEKKTLMEKWRKVAVIELIDDPQHIFHYLPGQVFLRGLEGVELEHNTASDLGL